MKIFIYSTAVIIILVVISRFWYYQGVHEGWARGVRGYSEDSSTYIYKP